MSFSRRRVRLLLGLLISAAAIGIFCIVRYCTPPRFNSGITSVRGVMAAEGPFSYPQPVAANEKDDPVVIAALDAALSSVHWDPLHGRDHGSWWALTVRFRNGESLKFDCNSENLVSIHHRDWCADEKKLQSALDLLLNVSLERMPEGDSIALNGKISSVYGGIKLRPGPTLLVRLHPGETAEFERVLSERKPSHYKADAVVGVFWLRLHDGSTVLVLTYQGGQVMAEEHPLDNDPRTMIAHCSSVDPAKLAALYSAWLPKASRIWVPKARQ